MTYDVFVSYSSKNKAVADAVCAAIEATGIKCWIAPRDILPGREWSEAIIDALSECRVMILVFSTPANESQQVKREAERAVNKGMAILPFRVEDIYPSGAMEYYLSTSHWLDALQPPMEDHLARLTETVQKLLAGDTLWAPPASYTPGQPGNLAAQTAGGIGVLQDVSTAEGGAQAALPANLNGFNWGAFLLNRSWLGAHNTQLGCLTGIAILAPYIGILCGLIFGFATKWVWVLLAGVIAWFMVGLRGNKWAWQNRRWINASHFQGVEKRWALKGVAFWVVVALLSTAFVKTGLNRRAQAFVMQKLKDPNVTKLKKEVNKISGKIAPKKPTPAKQNNAKPKKPTN